MCCSRPWSACSSLDSCPEAKSASSLVIPGTAVGHVHVSGTLHACLIKSDVIASAAGRGSYQIDLTFYILLPVAAFLSNMQATCCAPFNIRCVSSHRFGQDGVYPNHVPPAVDQEPAAGMCPGAYSYAWACMVETWWKGETSGCAILRGR